MCAVDGTYAIFSYVAETYLLSVIVGTRKSLQSLDTKISSLQVVCKLFMVIIAKCCGRTGSLAHNNSTSVTSLFFFYEMLFFFRELPERGCCGTASRWTCSPPTWCHTLRTRTVITVTTGTCRAARPWATWPCQTQTSRSSEVTSTPCRTRGPHSPTGCLPHT